MISEGTSRVSVRSLAVHGLVLLTFAGISGCGSSQPKVKLVPTVPAEGVLLDHGKPLAFHQINVIPEEGPAAIAVSDAEGHFVLATNRPGDGAPAGTHRVSIVYVGNPADDPNSKGLANVYIPPPEPSVKIDVKYRRPETSGITLEIPAAGKKDLNIDLK